MAGLLDGCNSEFESPPFGIFCNSPRLGGSHFNFEFPRLKPGFARESGRKRTFLDIFTSRLNPCTKHVVVFDCLVGQDVVGS